MGLYAGWTDDDLANIAIGNPAIDVQGAGVNSLRVLLPEYFLEFFGYTVRESTFQHYSNLGAPDNVAIIGYPTDEHRYQGVTCPSKPSESFENLFLPIWDDGSDGNPINEENYYAHYVYRMVDVYKDQVRFWEVQNEPDADISGNGGNPPGTPNNWYENVPDPCEYSFSAPIFHYIRMLRIAYEVVHYLDPDGYVAVGGLGIPSFLDLILRHTDNPEDGSVSAEYPLLGGAYFDVLSYHSYPILDGSMRYYSQQVGGFVFERHSDRTGDAVVEKGNTFQLILDEYGYDGLTYPRKEFICTEYNVPRKTFTFYGADDFQRNSAIKTAIALQKANIKQMHLYTLGDLAEEADATTEFQLKGMYKSLASTVPYQVEKNEIAIGYKTMGDAIGGKTFDAAQTSALQLPPDVNGAAYFGTDGYTYVLWARTTIDRSELAQATYSMPSNIATGFMEVKAWDYSATGQTSLMDAQNITLSGDPIFIKATGNVGFNCTAGVDQTICQGESITLTASASGGFGPYTYNWNGLGAGSTKEVHPLITTTYSVEVTDNTGATCTAQVTITVLPACSARLGDRVFEDTNGNGIQDDGEPGIANVGVQLNGTDYQGQPVSLVTTTNANGLYGFGALFEGTYTLSFQQLPGFTFAPQNSGNDPAIDSDVNPQSGQTNPINIQGNDLITDIDAGLVPVSEPGLNLSCPGDFTVNIPAGQSTATVNWTEPSGISDCPFGTIGILQLNGPQNGASLAEGNYTLQYYAYDGCSNQELCAFTISVQASGETPPSSLTLACPGNVQATIPAGATTIAVSWTLPTVTSDCSNGSPQLVQTGGLSNGSQFGSGTTTIQYTASDNCGNQEVCSFTVTVEEAEVEPPTTLTLTCPNNITATLPQGTATMPISWSSPTVFSDCPTGNVSLQQLTGPASGSAFTEGVTTIQYSVSDNCGNQTNCSFTITVEAAEIPVSTLSLDCPANISVTLSAGQSSTSVSWDAPDGFSDCTLGGLGVQQIAGPQNGSALSEGLYTVQYSATDNCGNQENCSFSINVEAEQAGFNLTCSGDIVVTLPNGANTVPVNWVEPVATSDCPYGSVGILQLEGPPNGSNFSLGTTTIQYYAYDGCADGGLCNFNVTVVPEGQGLAESNINRARGEIIFPNPTRGIVHIDLSAFARANTQVMVYDANQRMQGQWEWGTAESERLELNLQSLANGLYTLLIVQENAAPIRQQIVIIK